MPVRSRWAFVRSVATLLGIAAVCRTLAGEQALAIVAQGPALATGCLLTLISFGCYAARFRASMRIVGLRLTLPQAFQLCARALFFHCLMPLSVGNDVTRYALCQAAAPALTPRRIAGGIVLDHALGTIALLLLAAASAGYFVSAPVLPWLALTALAGGGLALLFRRPGSWELARLQRQRRAVLEALCLSLVMHGLLAWAVFHTATAGGLSVGWLEVLAVMAIGSLLQIVPMNFGGLHLGDVAATGLYVALGHPLADALALGSLAYCFRILLALVGGGFELRAAQPMDAARTAGPYAALPEDRLRT